jgi:hypothetical protein
VAELKAITPVYIPTHQPFDPPAQPEPASIGDAIDEVKRIGLDILGIDQQLGNMVHTDDTGRRLSREETEEWRRRAKSAKRFKQERKVFLDAWIRNRPKPEPEPRRHESVIGATGRARDLARIVGLLEAVFVSARLFCENPTTENHRELSRHVEEVIRADSK